MIAVAYVLLVLALAFQDTPSVSSHLPSKTCSNDLRNGISFLYERSEFKFMLLIFMLNYSLIQLVLSRLVERVYNEVLFVSSRPNLSAIPSKFTARSVLPSEKAIRLFI